MKRPTDQQLRDRLTQPGPRRQGQPVDAVTPPDQEMAVWVTLDMLKPYEHNPRQVQNPKYEDIKASIRAAGLKHKPPVTQRPGEKHYTICDGGNTRLQILRELYEETGESRFHAFYALYRPWQSEVKMLTGHLSENDNRGQLLWIERAKGVMDAKAMYEEESGELLSQRELVKRLSEDGYQVAQSHISKMLYTVEHLLPTLPNTLYSGLGRPQVEKLISYREACRLIWERCTQEVEPEGFAEAWHQTIAWFDDEGQTEMNWGIVVDRLCGMLADHTGVHFNVCELTLDNIVTYRKRRWDLEEHQAFEALDVELQQMRDPDAQPPSLYPPLPDTSAEPAAGSAQKAKAPKPGPEPQTEQLPSPRTLSGRDVNPDAGRVESAELLRLRQQVAALEREKEQLSESQSPVVSGLGEPASVPRPAPMASLSEEEIDWPVGAARTEAEQAARLEGLTQSSWEESPGKRGYRHHLASELGVPSFDFEQLAPLAAPVLSGETTPPIADVWFIEGVEDEPRSLRIRIRELVQVIARWGGFGGSDVVIADDNGIGFDLNPLPDAADRRALLAWQALASLRGELNPEYPSDATLWGALLGTHREEVDESAWDDAVLLRFFRLVRLIRRLREHLQVQQEAQS
ncbi:ParB family protein [Halomonas sp. NO4]|uniref:ParB family protein n=1 Tax=Halomonas sp. NO4 TaxID=2484813 RepID=UPI0013D59771|nr:ParB family protein [Halomonas sp. NO4]